MVLTIMDYLLVMSKEEEQGACRGERTGLAMTVAQSATYDK
jgi:hypothetical protein